MSVDLLSPAERRVLAALRGPSGEVLQLIFIQPLRASFNRHLLGQAVDVPRRTP